MLPAIVRFSLTQRLFVAVLALAAGHDAADHHVGERGCQLLRHRYSD